MSNFLNTNHCLKKPFLTSVTCLQLKLIRYLLHFVQSVHLYVSIQNNIERCHSASDSTQNLSKIWILNIHIQSMLIRYSVISVNSVREVCKFIPVCMSVGQSSRYFFNLLTYLKNSIVLRCLDMSQSPLTQPSSSK